METITGRYRLLTILGSGGMGRVWRAHDDLLDRDVAVKEIIIGGDQDRTVREARAAARLDHPHVVRIYDVVRTPGRSWIVMEYVAGRSLHDVVRQDGPLSHPAAARIGVAVLDALRTAHAAGVLHRDVKPPNVLVGADGRVVLTDFGLAALWDPGDAAGDESTGTLVGSPNFVAPERVRHRISGAPGDLWSLGATLYAAVEGRPPYQRPTVTATLAALLTQAPDAPARPGPLHAVINGLLVRDPAQRLGTDNALAALRAVASPAAADRTVAARAVARLAATDLAIADRAVASLAATDRAVGVSRVPVSRRTRPVDQVVRYRPAAVSLPAPPPASDPPAPRHPMRRTPIVIVAAMAVLLGAAGVAVAADRAASTEPPPPATATVTGAPAADGWVEHSDPAGFRLDLPVGWRRTVTGDTVTFRDPAGDRVLTVTTDAPPAGDPLDYWRAAERAARADGSLPGYARVSMGALTFQGGGADWEYTWQPASGPRLHTRRVLLSRVASWTAPDADWAAGQAVQQRVLASLRSDAA